MHKLLLIINLRTAIIAVLAVASTWACRHFGLTANFSTTFLLTAVVFPLAFSINSAYERREKALKDYATLKGNGRALYFALRDWIDHHPPGTLEALRNHLEALLNRLERCSSKTRARLKPTKFRFVSHSQTCPTLFAATCASKIWLRPKSPGSAAT